MTDIHKCDCDLFEKSRAGCTAKQGLRLKWSDGELTISNDIRDNLTYCKGEGCPYLEIERLKGRLGNEECDSAFERERADKLETERNGLKEQLLNLRHFHEERAKHSEKCNKGVIELEKELEAERRGNKSCSDEIVKLREELKRERAKRPKFTNRSQWLRDYLRSLCNETGRV